jgi:hypothetical protein
MSPMLPLLLALATQDADAARPADVPIPEKVQAEEAKDDPPTVAIRVEENGDRVEEYRQNGMLYMVKITPENGPPYYLYDNNANGRLERDDSLPKVSPVYWTLYEWD